MSKELEIVKIGLALVLLGLLFGVGMGISFGVNEDAYKVLLLKGLKPTQRRTTKKAKIRFGVRKELIFMRLEYQPFP